MIQSRINANFIARIPVEQVWCTEIPSEITQPNVRAYIRDVTRPTISMVLFGFWNILTGYLIFRSTFLPRILRVLLAISGFYYQINNFAEFLSPPIAARVEPYVFVIGMAELLLALWLVGMGVNEQRWEEQASAAGES